MAAATAAATVSAPGRASSVTTTRCLARYAYHWRYGEWPGRRAAAAPSKDSPRSLQSVIIALARLLLEDVKLEEVRHHVVGHVDHVADVQIAGDAAEEVRLLRGQRRWRRRSRSRQQGDHLEQRVARRQRHVLRLVPERGQQQEGRVHVDPVLR